MSKELDAFRIYRFFQLTETSTVNISIFFNSFWKTVLEVLARHPQGLPPPARGH